MFYLFKINKLFLSGISIILALLMCSALIFGGTVKTQSDVKSLNIAVIMYHGLVKSENRQNKYMISPSYFESDLQYLKENGYNSHKRLD